MSSGSSQEKIPFEPRSKKKKVKASPESKDTPPTDREKTDKEKSEPLKVATEPKTQEPPKKKKNDPKIDRSQTTLSAIPEVVSKRMIKRMAIFSGVPTFLGFLSFIVFYLVVNKGGIEIPNVAVLIVSIIFFGSGFLGLSYGIFSTSWDENTLGSVWGWDQFTLNFKRTVAAWQETRKEAKARKKPTTKS